MLNFSYLHNILSDFAPCMSWLYKFSIWYSVFSEWLS